MRFLKYITGGRVRIKDSSPCEQARGLLGVIDVLDSTHVVVCTAWSPHHSYRVKLDEIEHEPGSIKVGTEVLIPEGAKISGFRLPAHLTSRAGTVTEVADSNGNLLVRLKEPTAHMTVRVAESDLWLQVPEVDATTTQDVASDANKPTLIAGIIEHSEPLDSALVEAIKHLGVNAIVDLAKAGVISAEEARAALVRAIFPNYTTS